MNIITDEKDMTKTIVVNGTTEQSIVPAPGDIVTAMVTTVNQRFCKCIMKCIGDVVLSRPYRGILRKEDVRATEKDRVELYKCFRVGDIILARVVCILFIYLSNAFNFVCSLCIIFYFIDSFL